VSVHSCHLTAHLTTPHPPKLAMEAGSEGPARESAALAAYELLNALLARDADVAAALNAATGAPRYAPLDRLLGEPQRLAALLMFARYPEPAIQTEAIRWVLIWGILCAGGSSC